MDYTSALSPAFCKRIHVELFNAYNDRDIEEPREPDFYKMFTSVLGKWLVSLHRRMSVLIEIADYSLDDSVKVGGAYFIALDYLLKDASCCSNYEPRLNDIIWEVYQWLNTEHLKNPHQIPLTLDAVPALL